MSAAGKGGFGGPEIGGGPAPIQQPSQPDIYQRYGGQQNVDSDPNTAGYQPPTASPMQPPRQQLDPGMPGGKSGGGKGGITMPYNPGPAIGGGPAPLDPNAPSPLGPEGQQPVTPQPPAGTPGGKSGSTGPFDMRAVVTPEMQARQLTNFDPNQFTQTHQARQLTPEQLQALQNNIFGTPGSNQQLDPNRVLL